MRDATRQPEHAGEGGIAYLPSAASVTVAALEVGTLALWVRRSGADEFVVSNAVPAGSVAGWRAHVRTHASPQTAQSLGLVVCSIATCALARAWSQAALGEAAGNLLA